MDFIQNEINYNLIILYIKDFIQYELELGKVFNMSNNLIDYLEKTYEKRENQNITVFFSKEEYTEGDKSILEISNWLWARLIVKNKKNDKTIFFISASFFGIAYFI